MTETIDQRTEGPQTLTVVSFSTFRSAFVSENEETYVVFHGKRATQQLYPEGWMSC